MRTRDVRGAHESVLSCAPFSAKPKNQKEGDHGKCQAPTSAKPQMKYRVVNGRNPTPGAFVRDAVICGRSWRPETAGVRRMRMAETERGQRPTAKFAHPSGAAII